MSKARKHLYISGRVQGVGFRAFTKREAEELNLSGWVKNLADGRVEAIICGEKSKVEELLKLLKDGPRLARVDKIEVSAKDYKDEFEAFTIRY